MATTFAERLRWARYRGPAARREQKVIGATTLARAAGCAQSLISGLERNNAKGSEHNNRFADALGVPRGWLATGDAPTPEGFDESDAHKMLHMGGPQLLTIVHGSPGAHGRQGAPAPRWTREAPPVARTADDEGSEATPATGTAASLQRSLMDCFMKFVHLVGPERAETLLELMRGYAETLRQSAARQNQS